MRDQQVHPRYSESDPESPDAQTPTPMDGVPTEKRATPVDADPDAGDDASDAGAMQASDAGLIQAKGRFRDPELARKAALERWSRGREREMRSQLTVQVPLDELEVFEGLKRAAKRGNAQAAREYREWLGRYQAAAEEGMALLKLQDLTPEQLELARAYCERRAVRAAQRLERMRRLTGEPTDERRPPLD